MNTRLIVSWQGLALTQENKEEIARLVLSSIGKQHLQEPETEGPPSKQPPARARRDGRSKRVQRRRRKSSRSNHERQVNFGTTETSGAEPHNYFSYSSGLNGPAEAEACFLPEGNARGRNGRHATTVIRQSVEKRAKHIEVSLDGLWLPALSPSGSSDADRRRLSEGAARWAEPPPPSTSVAFGSAATPSSRTRYTGDFTSDGAGKWGSRPVTVASQSPFGAKGARTGAARIVGERRSRAVTAGGGGAGQRAGQLVGQRATLVHARARHGSVPDGPESFLPFDEAHGEIDEDDVPVDGAASRARLASGGAREVSGNDDTTAAAAMAMSHSTAAMLKRSRELVARAKVGRGAPFLFWSKDTAELKILNSHRDGRYRL